MTSTTTSTAAASLDTGFSVERWDWERKDLDGDRNFDLRAGLESAFVVASLQRMTGGVGIGYDDDGSGSDTTLAMEMTEKPRNLEAKPDPSKILPRSPVL